MSLSKMMHNRLYVQTAFRFGFLGGFGFKSQLILSLKQLHDHRLPSENTVR